MDIRGLYNLLMEYVDNGVLDLPMGAIPSEPINSLYPEFMNGGPLKLGNATPQLNVGANIITIDDTSGLSFPLTGTTVDAVFTIINDVPQMELAAHLPPGAGSLTKPFPALKDDPTFKALAFSDTSLLSLASYDVAPTRPRGLALEGAVLLQGELGSIRILFNSDRLAIGGPMTVEHDIPVFSYISPDEGTVAVGTFGVLFMTFELANAAVEQNGAWSPSSRMQVVSGIRYDTAAGKQQLSIYTPPPFEPTGILFQGDITEALDLGLAAISQLADSANVQGLLPTQLPIPAIVQFRTWTMLLDVTNASLRMVSLNIRLNTNWEIVPDLLDLNFVDFTFTYTKSAQDPLSMVAQAEIALGEAPDPGIITVVAYYPGFRFNGRLDPKTQINLKTLMKRFIGEDAASILPDGLAINELSFSVDPANVNFSITVGVAIGWDFDIGGVAFSLLGIRGSVEYVAQKVSGFISGSIQILEDNPFTVELTAGYKGADGGWYFISKLKDGTIPLGQLIAYYAPPLSAFSVEGLQITALELRMQTGTNQSYGFTIAVKWDITSGGANIAVLGASIQLDSVLVQGVRTYVGIIKGTASFWGVSMSVTVDMTTPITVYTFTLWEFSATLRAGILTFNFPQRSLGELITLLVNAAFPDDNITLPPPFNVLNAIRLSDFEFTFDFNTGNAKIRYPRTGTKLNLNFGFLVIDQFELAYDGTLKIVELKISAGRFLDQTLTPTNPQNFNVTDPSSMANTVPGQGEELFRLKFLGMGQHVSPKTPIPPGATIATAVTMLENAFKKTSVVPPPIPPPGQPPIPVAPIAGTDMKFDDAANWIIAADFTILRTVTIKALFLDPELYGVSISVQGPKGGNFNGLGFDILYRRVNDNVGVYQIELKLPDAFRQLEFGTVTITLPIIKLEIFTNGDFRVDLGFPTNGDFSRSFGVQVLPFTGAGGIYFGVMSGASSTKVPQVENCGQFSPVLELGVGLRVGLGKEINKGILSAGLSLTLQGIVEGVIAWYSPYDSSTSNKAFFYSIKGKFAIVGNLYGEINFAIISARLDITITLGVTLSVEIYQPFQFGFFASVRVSLTVKVNLGIFKISISLSFQTSIQENFTIGSRQPAPWDCGLTAAQRKAVAGTVPRGSMQLDEDQCPDILPQLNWQPIELDGQDRWKVEVLAIAQLTAASPIAEDGSAGDAKPRAVTSLFSRTTPGTGEEDAPFFILAKGIFLWGVNAWLFREQQGVTLAELLAATVTAEDLESAYCGTFNVVAGSVEPFTEEQLDAFVSGFYELNVKVATEQQIATDVSAVPMVPAITMTLPDGTTTIPFADFNETSTDVLDAIKLYFRQLEMRAEKAAQKTSALRSDEITMSMASFLWMDFFNMIAREAIQAAMDTLQSATLTATGNESLQDLLDTRPLLGRSVADVARANLLRKLQVGRELRLPQSRRRKTNAGTFRTTAQHATLLAVARHHDVDPIELATLNANVQGLFAPGRILVPNAEGLTVQQLLDMMDEQKQFENLSGLAARVLLAGLRPPYPDPDDPATTSLQALYEISGQQFDATGIDTQKPLTLEVAAADWIKLAGGTTLEMYFTQSEVDIATAFTNIQLTPTYDEAPHAEALYRIEPKRFTLANPIEWSDGATSTGIWTFPDDLQTLITGEHALQPKVEIVEETQDAAFRAPYEVTALLGAIPHTWTTTFPIVVRRIPSAVDPSRPIEKTYDLRGTSQGGGLLLQDLLEWWHDNGQPDIVTRIEILYPPDPAQENPPDGLVSAPYETTSIFVLQTNLSTVSNPANAALMSRRKRGATEDVSPIIGQTAIELLRLVWECSIVRSGGYDFYYDANDAGLPEYLFEQDSDVELTVVVSYDITDDVLQSFLNSVVLGQTVDTGTDSVYFIRPVVQNVPSAMIAHDATLLSLARRHHATVGEIARLNRSRRLRVRRRLALAGATIETQEGDTLAKLALRHSTSIAAIARLNQDVRYLFEDTPIVEDQLVERIVQIPQGNVAWAATRISPDAPQLSLGAAVTPEEAQKGLEELYNLLTFMIAGTPAFRATDWALPAGPARDDVPPSDPNETLDARFQADLDEGVWPYRAVLPVAKFSTASDPVLPPDAGGPPLADDPYRGVGTDVVLDLVYLDMFGNRVKTNGDQPTRLTIPIRYFDDLMPIDEWAGSGAAYTITGDGTNPATLTATLSFDTSPYLSPPEGGPNPVELALAVEQKYAHAWYQLVQPDVIVGLNATSDTSIQTDTTGAKTALIQYLGAVYDFLHAIATSQTPVEPEPKSITRTVAADNTSDLFELVVGVTIARTKYIDPDLDDPAFVAVRSVMTNIRANYTEPVTGEEEDPLPQPLTLTEFAELLETAFPGMKVAVGTPETGSDGAPRPREVWLLRLSETGGVWYSIDKTAPRYYAIAPVSRAPESDTTEIYPYVSGQFIGDSTPSQQSFSNVDLEVLAQECLAAVEQFLSADYVVPAWQMLVDAGEQRPNAVDDILAAKKVLAGKIADTVAPVLASQLSPPANALADAVESVRQQLLINLSDAYSIDTVVQYPIDVVSAFADPAKSPRLYGKPLMIDATQEEAKNFSFTTTRFSLEAGSRYLTFTFATRSDQAAAVVSLPLRLGISSVEQPLDTVPGIEDYRPSSWLTFAIPFAEDSSERDDLGTPEIPVPLRAYPTPPSMSAQHGVPLIPAGEEAEPEDDLQEARAWLYDFTYDYPPADQDTIYATVVFQSASMVQKAEVEQLTLFDALLQFSVVYRSILADLNRTLLVPNGDPTVGVNAIKSLAWVVGRAAEAWSNRTQQTMLAQTASPEVTVETKVKESSTTYDGIPGVLLITLTPLNASPVPVVSIEGYDTVAVGTEGDQYVFTDKVTGFPLMRIEGLQNGRRTLTYDGLDIMIEESARSGTLVRRNEDFGGKQANEIFIYQTPEIRFFTALTPVLEPGIDIDIAQYTSPLPATLEDILKNFFHALFDGTPEGATHTLRFGGRFSYPLQRVVPLDPTKNFPVALPIFLTGPVLIESDADLDALAARTAAFTMNWFDTNGITGKFGRLGFDVSLYAGAASTQLPTLRLTRLYADTASVLW